MYFVTYLLAPKYCHSFVGYLEAGVCKKKFMRRCRFIDEMRICSL
jgi:hypothetical protein